MGRQETILVTGGAGFIGSHFVRHAVDEGREVVVLDDLTGGKPAPLPKGVKLVTGDIGDRKIVDGLVKEFHVGAVAHFAGKLQIGESMREPAMYFDVNVARTLRLLEAVQQAGIGNFLFSSSASVYGSPTSGPIPESARREPVNTYGATKLSIELALEAWTHAYGLRWGALRYFNAAGAHPDGTLRENHQPETHLIPLVVDAGMGRGPAITVFGSDYETPDGTCVRDYIHVMDLASAHLAALHALEGGESLGGLNLGTGSGHSVREVIEMAARQLSRQIPHSIAGRRIGDPPRLVADSSAANRVLGWSPRCSDLATILEDVHRSRSSGR